MRKRIIERNIQHNPEPQHDWLNLKHLAQAEITSENAAHPFEAALLAGGGSWQAAESGEQTLRLLFDHPQDINVIRLLFVEETHERTQEFVLRFSTDDGHALHDIARQQFNFSRPDSTRELEDYRVDLAGVTTLELSIIPNISGGDTRATLAEWRIA